MKELLQIRTRSSRLAKRWIAPPVFPDDELKTSRAGLLDKLLFATVALVVITLIGSLLAGRAATAILQADMVAVVFCLILHYWVHKGHIRWASLVLISAFLIGISIFSASLGTIRTPATAFYFVIVVGAGFLFDRTGIIVTTVLSSLAILGLVSLENAGWLPQPDYNVTITQWITYTTLIGLTGGLTWSAIQSGRRALRRAEREIAERKRAEEELQTSEAYVRSIIESSVDMIITTDNERRIMEFNRAAQETFGYSREEVLGEHVEMLYAQANESAATRATFLKEGKFIGQINNKRKTGEIFPSSLTVSTLRGANGVSLGVVGVSRDISERQQAEQARQQAEEKYRKIFETAVEGIFQLTRAGRVITANPALAHMWGYESPSELVAGSTDIARQACVEPECRSEFQQLIIDQDYVQGFEHQVRRKDGTMMWVSENAHAVRDANGAFLYYEGTLEDITRRKKIEGENVRRTAQLEALRQTSLELTAQLDLQALLSAICERAAKLVRATTVSFYLHRPERELLERVIFHGPALVSSASTRYRGQGLIGKVWETREPVVVNDYQKWTERNTSYDKEPHRAVAGIPISWGKDFLGVLTVVADPPQIFATEDVELLKLFADQAAIAIENARLFESTKHNSDRVALLNTIARTVGSTIELDELLETCLNQLLQVIHADSVLHWPV